jgi:hypothetical protein
MISMRGADTSMVFAGASDRINQFDSMFVEQPVKIFFSFFIYLFFFNFILKLK